MRPTLLVGLVGLLGLTACGNPATPAGYVGYLTRGAIVGKASYVGLQTGPTSYGASWLVKVMNVSVTPFSYAEDFTGENAVLTKDKLIVSFRAHTIFRVRGDKVKEFIEQYTTLGEGPNQVQVAFGNYLKEPLRTADPGGGGPLRRLPAQREHRQDQQRADRAGRRRRPRTRRSRS